MLYEANESKLRFILFHAFSRRQESHLPTYKNIKNNIFILFLIFWLTLPLSSEKSVKQN